MLYGAPKVDNIWKTVDLKMAAFFTVVFLHIIFFAIKSHVLQFSPGRGWRGTSSWKASRFMSMWTPRAVAENGGN